MLSRKIGFLDVQVTLGPLGWGGGGIVRDLHSVSSRSEYHRIVLSGPSITVFRHCKKLKGMIGLDLQMTIGDVLIVKSPDIVCNSMPDSGSFHSHYTGKE